MLLAHKQKWLRSIWLFGVFFVCASRFSFSCRFFPPLCFLTLFALFLWNCTLLLKFGGSLLLKSTQNNNKKYVKSSLSFVFLRQNVTNYNTQTGTRNPGLHEYSSISLRGSQQFWSPHLLFYLPYSTNTFNNFYNNCFRLLHQRYTNFDMSTSSTLVQMLWHCMPRKMSINQELPTK